MRKTAKKLTEKEKKKAEEIKKLTQEEFFALETNHLKQNLFDKELSIISKDIQNLDTEVSLMKMTIENLSFKKANLIAHQSNTIKKRQTHIDDHQCELEAIRERLGIKGRFGFNPETLEIVGDS